MSFETIQVKLHNELKFNKLGHNRIFKFVHDHTKSKSLTIAFLINVLNYKPWQANQIAYNIEYKKQRYQIKKMQIS